MSERVLNILKERRAELAAIESPVSNWAKVTEWHARTRPIIGQEFSGQLDAFEELASPRWSHPSVTTLDGRNLDGRNHAKINEGIAASAQKKLLGHMDALIELLGIEGSTEVAKKESVGGKSVFLVHGHNERWLHEVARYVEQFGLDVTILREQPNEGNTIIEKFEVHAEKAAFAVVLLTGDDRGGVRSVEADKFSLRARQNVILELGFFLGTLGRSCVCALYEDGVEIPSDYSGVLFVSIDGSGAWKMLLAREMKAAGLDVDLNLAV